LTEAKYKIDAKFAVAGRLEYVKFASSDIKGYGVAVAPSYKVTENLEVRGQVGYRDLDGASTGDEMNVGVQTVFTF
jgi:outer membrane scaffolding protein for murein synthesis (MipA/OmpV family)